MSPNSHYSFQSIIAVNYPARARGVTRYMRGDEALKQCPEIKLISVPSVGEKADLTKYREAGEEVANVLQRYTVYLERASIDEAYLDITEAAQRLHLNLEAKYYRLEPIEYVDTYSVGHEFLKDYIAHLGNLYKTVTEKNADLPADLKREVFLIYGAAIANEIRAAVKSETGYDCSVGISHNKILAKLACGINKPKKQTILSYPQISAYFEKLPLKKIRGLGGKFGENVTGTLNVYFVGQLIKFSESELKLNFGEKNGLFLYNICRGIDQEPVKPRLTANSIGTSKRFPGKNQINNLYKLIHWLYELSNEMCARLDKDYLDNNRKGKLLVVSYKQAINGDDVLSTRSVPLKNYELSNVFKQSIDVIKNNTASFINSGSSFTLNNAIKFLGISVGKFEPIASTSNILQKMFTAHSNSSTVKNESNIMSNEINELTNTNKINNRNQQINTATELNISEKKQQDAIDVNNEKDNSIDLKEKEEFNKKLNINININEQPDHNFFTDSDDMNEIESLLSSLENSSTKTNEIRNMSDNQLKKCTEKQTHIEDEQKDESKSNVENITEKNINIDNVSQTKKRKYNENFDSIDCDIQVDNCNNDQNIFHIKCKTCGELIDNIPDSILTHEDYHLAEKLDLEINAENKILKSTKMEQFNKRKKQNPPEILNCKPDIRKFFGTVNESQNSLSSCQTNFDEISNSDTDMCPECKLFIKKSELNEHIDFHVAKKLQKELNSIQKISTETKKSTINNRQTQKTANSSKTISSFFVKKDQS